MQKSDKEVLQEKETIMENAMLNALAYAAIIGDLKDEISEGKAWSMYGKAWITDRTERGWIHFIRNGNNTKSTKLYSRFEIESQKRAEKNIERAYNNAQQSMKQLK
ncbi:MAG: hypothetical protein NC035_09040 [Bacteroides sp.]|nr:hypothetical protein [Bacteroides sp.]